jgi:hypothetical protein
MLSACLGLHIDRSPQPSWAPSLMALGPIAWTWSYIRTMWVPLAHISDNSVVVHKNLINIKVSQILEMWDTSVIAKVLNGLILPPKLEVVNRTEHDNILVHVNIIPRKYGRFLCSPVKHKKISIDRVFNDSCETLWSKKVTNSSLNNQPSLLVNTTAPSSKQ